jgi:bla regulator protein BlaR1
MIPAIGNHLWQTTLFAAAAALVVFALRCHPARVRHWIWLAASLKFLVPFALLVGVGHQVAPRTALVAVSPGVSAAIADLTTQISFAPAAKPAAQIPPELLWGIWACGFLTVAVCWVSRWRRVRRMVRSASPLNLPLPIRARSSPALIEPGVFGIFHPVLLLPAGIAARLSPAELRAILAHELCHVRRRDNLAALVHMTVEAIFWFHPLVWFLGARLVEERERACDEEVLRLGNHPEIYAGGILNACRLYLESPLACVSGVTGADLRKRVERIMTDRLPRHLGPGGKLLLTAAGFVALAAPLAIGLLHAQGRPAFEVASVKVNKTGERMGRIGPVDRARFIAVNIPLAGLVMTAYDVNIEQISGWPEWAHTERFDVEAKAEHPASRQEINAMLQTLLAERFHLVLHRETREQPIYALVMDKVGPKLKPHPAAPEPATRPGEGMPIRPGDKGQVIFNGVQMDRLAWFLGTRLHRRVIDRTGLAGSYDFDLAWDGDPRLEGFGDAPPDPGSSVFSALHELGLKLESLKGPVEFLTIEHLERPTEN